MLPSLDGAIFDPSNAAPLFLQLNIKKLKLNPSKQSKRPEETSTSFGSIGDSMPGSEDAAKDLPPPPLIEATLSKCSFFTPVSNRCLVWAPGKAQNEESNASDLSLFPALLSVSAIRRSREALPLRFPTYKI